MKFRPPIAGLCVLALAALTGSARLAAQDLPAAVPAAGAVPAIQFKVESERSVPIAGGGRLILQRVAEPVLPPAPPVFLPPPLTPGQRAARAAVQAARPAPMQSRLLALNVTVFAEGQTYIEWWPHAGGAPFAAWSSADFRYLSLVPDFEIVSNNTLYCVFPFGVHTYQPRPGRPPLAHLPVPVRIPPDGPGFVLVKGDPSDKETIKPITALHQIYKEEGAQLKAAWEDRERARAAAAAQPPPPPGDVVIRFWPLRSEPAAPAAAQTPAPAAR